MEVKKVSLPESGWLKPLQKLVREDRFEQKKRKLQGLDIDRHFKNSLKKTDLFDFFVCLKNCRPVGWIKTNKNLLHSRTLDRKIYYTNWELIANNNNEIRKIILKKILQEKSDSQIIFQQPRQNRAALELYENMFTPAGSENLLYINPEDYKKSYSLPPNFQLNPLTDISREVLEELISHYEGGHLFNFPGYPRVKAKKLYRDWLVQLAPRPNYYSRILTYKNRTVGIICANELPDSFPAEKKCGSIAYIQVHPEHTGGGLGGLLLQKGLEQLKSRGVEYVELKVNSQNTNARKFYKKQGFKSISERVYFTNLP
jgi:ribosomal protein S18 acetylase RimI-like enzyme